MEKRKEERVLAEISDIQSYVKMVLENARKGKYVYRGHASKRWPLC